MANRIRVSPRQKEVKKSSKFSRQRKKKDAQRSPELPGLNLRAASIAWIECVRKILRDLGIIMVADQELSSRLKVTCYESEQTKRQHDNWRRVFYASPKIKLYLGETGAEAGKPQALLRVEKRHGCHPEMQEILREHFQRSYGWDPESNNCTLEDVGRAASYYAPRLAADYLRARQACYECMRESDRLANEARRFAEEAITAAMGT